MRATLKAIRAELRKRMHDDVPAVGKWLARVVQSHHQLRLSSGVGVIDIDVLHNEATQFGSASQKNNAIQRYLDQIDSAAKRGRADDALVAQYKTAFAAMHKIGSPSDSILTEKNEANTKPQFWDNSAEKLLTGLADFEAKITSKVSSSNPQRLLETNYLLEIALFCIPISA